jgi:hypothetical protein
VDWTLPQHMTLAEVIAQLLGSPQPIEPGIDFTSTDQKRVRITKRHN